MKIVYVKFVDPVVFEGKMNLTLSDIEQIEPSVLHVAGILLSETDSSIKLGEVELAEDNPRLQSEGHSEYRFVTVISKRCILERKDFEIEPETTA